MEYRQRGSLPCADCGTRGGHVPEGDKQPRRRRGLCDACYRWHLSARTLDRFPVVESYVTRSGKRTRIPSERRVERQEAIARRVALHETVGSVAPVPLVEGEAEAATRTENAERTAAEWLTARTHQAAAWDRPDLQAFIPGGMSTAA